MDVVKLKEDYVGTWIVDANTGEILTLVEDARNKPKVASFEKYVGIDTKYPSKCLTEDSLINALCNVDAYVSTNSSSIDSNYILSSILEGYLTKSEALLVSHIAKSLSGWNYHMTTIHDLAIGAGVDKSNISRLISKLSPNTLRVIHKDKPNKGCVVLKLNPIIAWKGDLSYREPAIQSWYTNNNIRKGK